LLKWAGVVETGGQAKELIAHGRIRVNGEVELRKGKQVQPGDRVEAPSGDTIVVVQVDEASSPTGAPRVS
jgi:ribosome-associated protein